MTATTRARIEAQLARKEAQLLLLDAALSSAATEVKEYKFNTGEGSQWMTYRDASDLMDSISRLEAQIEWLYRRLSGKGLINFNLRRKRSGYTSVV